MNKLDKISLRLLSQIINGCFWFLTHQKKFYSGMIIFVLFSFMLSDQSGKLTWKNWTGFGEDQNISTEETLQGDKLTLTKRITHHQSGKTLWDWLGLVGVIAIPIILFQFQRRQQEIADSNQREEALRDYVDKIAELLIDKELKILLKELSKGTIKKDDPKLDAALDVARARTLSILRTLDGDYERKGSVVRFLIDAELIQDLELLKEANLSRANLYAVNLEGVNLEEANLEKAKLKKAKLKKAKLTRASLEGANLEGANLEGANLKGANLKGAFLEEAILEGAYLEGANFKDASMTTPEKIKVAKDWDKAYYDSNFQKQLNK